MKRFACGDVVPGCDAVWEYPTDHKILDVVAVHAADVHELRELPAELIALVREHITTVS